MVGAGVAAAIVLTGGVAADPIALAAVLVANVGTLGLSGLLWRRARPWSFFGMLLLAEGVLVVVSSLAGASASGLYLVGVLGGWAAGLGATWLLVVFPRTRPEGAGWIVIGTAFAAFVLGELPRLLTSYAVSFRRWEAASPPARPIPLSSSIPRRPRTRSDMSRACCSASGGSGCSSTSRSSLRVPASRVAG